VDVDATPATNTSCNGTTCTATVPALDVTSPATVSVTVVDPGGNRSNAVPFTYTPPQGGAPSISAISPSFAPVGYSTQVTIVGSNLVGGVVNFGGTFISGACGAECVVNSPSSLPAGTVSVTVTVNGLTSNAVTFLVTSGTPPTISAVDGSSTGPNHGAPGGFDAIEIDGSGFDTTTIANNQFFIGPNAVTLNQCFVVSGSQQECRGLTPPGAGNAYVTLKTPAGATNPQFNTDLFQYVPVLSALGVQSGPAPGGTAVTLSGQGLAVAGATTRVYFGANPALDVSCTATQCLATSPPGAGTVAVSVAVQNQLPGGTFTTPASNTLSYTYVPPVTVTGVSPNAGPATGGTAVSVTGTGFNTVSGATMISFGGVAATGVSCASATSCAATSPAGCGVVDVTVTVSGGTSATSSADQFSYTPANSPCPPILQSPAEGTQNLSTTPTFTWQAPPGAVAGATVYTLFISQGNQQFTTTNTSYTVPASAALAPGTEIFWSVSACNGSACSAYAPAWGEFIAPLPGAPVQVAPAEGTTGLSTTPVLSWQAPANAFSGVTTYTVALSDVTQNIDLPWISTANLSATIPGNEGILAGDEFYWAVQACNGGNGCGPFARAWGEFTAPPGVPVLLTPAEGTQNILTTPTFTWQAPAGAVAGTTVYDVWITDYTTNTVLPLETTTATSLVVPASEGLQPAHGIYWTVAACNPGACSAYARAWGETIAPQPGAPGLTSPIEGSTTVSQTPTLQWTAASGAVGGTTQYTGFVWDPAAGVMKFQQSTTALSLAVPASAGLQPGTFYYYTAQACTGSVCGPLARWEGFTTWTTPGVPALLAPVEGSTGNGATPTLQWAAPSGAVPGATQYTAYVWDPQAGVMKFQQTVTALSVTVPASAGLQPGTFYYYTVSACNGSNCSAVARWEGFTS